VVSRRQLIGVELQPGRPGISVARLADAAGVEQPGAVVEIEHGAVACLGAVRVAPPGVFRTVEEERYVRVADQPDPFLLRVESSFCLFNREHVLPDRVAG